jgi:hypothetical protein
VSLEPRLRDALRAEAASIDPDIEGSLDTVRRRATRRAPIPPLAFLGLAAVLVVILVVRAGTSAPLGAGPSAAPQPTVPAPSGSVPAISSPGGAITYPAVAGTYSLTLGPEPGVAANGLAGLWTMTLEPSGVLDVTPPATFRAEGVAPTGNAFTQTGRQLRTNLFYNDYCNSIGTYAWQRSGGQLTLTVVDDACVVRRTLLATTPWQEVASAPTP